MASGFRTLGLNLVAFYDGSGRAVYSRAFDLAAPKVVPAPPDFSSLPAAVLSASEGR